MMGNQFRTRQHLSILLWDVAWMLLGVVIFLEVQGLRGREMSVVRQIGYGMTLFLFLAGVIDVIRWHGFLLTMDSQCIEVRRFWFFKKRYCRDAEQHFFAQTNQNSLDEWADKGTLDLYNSFDGASSLTHLANFSQIKRLVEAKFSY